MALMPREWRVVCADGRTSLAYYSEEAARAAINWLPAAVCGPHRIEYRDITEWTEAPVSEGSVS